MILLTGITGNVGGATAEALLEKGIKFKALVRDLEKASDFSAKGIEIVAGDLNDSSSLKSAMSDCDTAVLIMPNSQEQEELELNFIETAKNCGIDWLIKLSSPEAIRGTTSPIPLVHIAAEDALMASGMNWTLIRPSFFMQNLTGSIAGAKATGKLSMPMGDGNAAMTHVKDAGTFFAEVLTGDREQHYNKCYDVTGTDLLTFSQIAEQMSEVLGIKVEYENCDPNGFKEMLRPFMTSDWHSEAVAILFSEIADNTTPGELTDCFQKLVGREPISFKEFVTENS
ncbi:MAG: NmrA family NAD(P)-binding protein [Pseudomonadota bacterium]|nr:NmrA family NAD(P)-binding protein [Pseudomonadota bacterium]